MLLTVTMAKKQSSVPYKNINQMLNIIDEYATSPYTGLIASVKSEVEGLKLTDIKLTIMYAWEIGSNHTIQKRWSS